MLTNVAKYKLISEKAECSFKGWEDCSERKYQGFVGFRELQVTKREYYLTMCLGQKQVLHNGRQSTANQTGGSDQAIKI